jgi:hypothetical protein
MAHTGRDTAPPPKPERRIDMTMNIPNACRPGLPIEGLTGDKVWCTTLSQWSTTVANGSCRYCGNTHPVGPKSLTTETELPRDVLHEITSKPINGVSYRVRIDTKLEVYVDHADQWNRCGRLDCTPGADSLQLIADHFAGQLAKTRRIEQGWRGEVTPERIARDFDEAVKADEERTDRKAQVAKVLARKAAEAQS